MLYRVIMSLVLVVVLLAISLSKDMISSKDHTTSTPATTQPSSSEDSAFKNLKVN